VYALAPELKDAVYRKLIIPPVVSGRPVTNRGVHLQPFAFHGDWTNAAEYWTLLLQSMYMSWVIIINDGDSVRQKYSRDKSPLEFLLDAGIIPIIRDSPKTPGKWTGRDTFLWSVDLYGKHGLRAPWIRGNEPFDKREVDSDWLRRKKPTREQIWAAFMENWAEDATYIAANGGYVGFPDGPCYGFNPFESIKQYGLQWIFDQGLGFYAGHFYGKGRPLDYCFDRVNRLAEQLTWEQYCAALDDFAHDPNWNEGEYVLSLMNQQRKDWADPASSTLKDDTCWRGWEKVAWYAMQALGYVPPLFLTEGGWVVRDRAGSNPIDIRWPYTTPKEVARKTLEMYETPSPFQALCPWLLADEDMGGSGWPFDAWHGWAFSLEYGRQKPVIQTLQNNRPGSLPVPEPPTPKPEPTFPEILDLAQQLSGKLGQIMELTHVP
jgi:hypothetical protein